MQATTPGSAADRRSLRVGPCLPVLMVALLAVPTVMNAQVLTFTFQQAAGGLTLTGVNTATGSIAFANVSKFGVLSNPTTVTRTLGPSDYSVSTPVAVKVTKTGPSPTYTLQVRLMTASTYSWQVGGVTLAGTGFSTIATGQNYGSNLSFNVKIVIADSTTTGLSITQDLEYLAIAE